LSGRVRKSAIPSQAILLGMLELITCGRKLKQTVPLRHSQWV
jgi:hypothetical protein